jgi:hypothetical protein
MKSLARSPIMIVGAFVLPATSVGMIGSVDDAEALHAAHAQLRIDDCGSVGAHSARADRMVDRIGAAPQHCAYLVVGVDSGCDISRPR